MPIKLPETLKPGLNRQEPAKESVQSLLSLCGLSLRKTDPGPRGPLDQPKVSNNLLMVSGAEETRKTNR
jgi:hypothetical protein